MYCNHEYTNQEGRSLEKQVDSLEKNLAAANSRMAELETEKQEIQTNFNLFHASVQYILSPGVLDRKGWIEGLVNVKDVSKKYREEVLSLIEKAEQRAEQAEAQAAAMREVLEYVDSHYHPEVLTESKRVGCKFQNELLRCMRERARRALKSDAGSTLLDENKRMREALNEIANSNLQTIDWAMKRWIDSRVVNIAKAALEVNP